MNRLMKQHDDIELVAGVDPFLDLPNPFPVFSKIEECDIPVDVIIDFSTAKAVRSLVDYCLTHHNVTILM